jgi:DNA-binding CsgD family transcriptional regulator
MKKANKTLHQLLCKRDLVSLVDLINTSLNCTCEDDLAKLLFRLREIVPYEFAICGLAQIGDSGNLNSYKTINISYPEEWIKLYISKKYNLCDPVFEANFAKTGIQEWSETYKLSPPPRTFLSDARDFGLTGGYTFGMKSCTENASSLFSLSGKSIENHERTKIILSNIMPHFHQALIRVSNGQEKEGKISPAIISAREKEVLNWLKEGKSSWDVSKILNISESTVNYHIVNIMQKLGAVSRLHAVAIAAGSKLIDLH